jgi:hypothetical protein
MTGSHLAELRGLQSFIVRRAIRDDMDPALATKLASPLGRRLDEAAAAALTASGDEVTGTALEALDREFCAFLGQAILAQGISLQQYWTPIFNLGSELATPSRHGCGQPLMRMDARPGRFRHTRRTVWICRRCATVGDTPSGVELPGMLYRGGQLHVTLDVPGVTVGTHAWVTTSVEGIGTPESASPPRHVSMPVRSGAVTLAVHARNRTQGIRWLASAFVWGGNFAISRIPVASLNRRGRRTAGA